MVFRRGTRNVGSRSAEGRLPETGLLSYSGDQLLAFEAQLAGSVREPGTAGYNDACLSG